MTDADEAPSSLADLETLAGLDADRADSGPDSAQAPEADPDAGDFDLSRLATSSASAAVAAASADGAAGDDGTLDLAVAVVAAAPAALASATTATEPKPAPRGFWAGAVAGALVAGAAAAVMWGRAPATDTSAGVAPSSVARLSSGTSVAPVPVLAAPAPRPVPASVVQSLPSAAEPAAAVPAPTSDAPAAVAGARLRRPQGGGTSAPSSTARASASSVEQASASDPTAPPTRVAPAPAPRAASPGAMDSLLDEALTGKRRPQGATDPFADGVPATPSADDVTRAVQVLLPAIRGCAMGQSGVAQTLLIARSDGTVASVQVTGSPYGGTASGSCMEGVLRRAKLPRFKQSVFRVQFPLSIRAAS